MSQESEIEERDRDATVFEAWAVRTHGYWHVWLEEQAIINRVDPQKSDVILDAGCSTGRITREIARRCRHVYAVDFSPESIKILNKKIREQGTSNVDSFVWDITQPLFLPEPVDKVVCTGVVQCIPTHHQRHLALQNMYNQLRPNGTLILEVYNGQRLFRHDLTSLALGVGPLEKEGQSGGLHYHLFTVNEAVAALRECGFQNISVKGLINYNAVDVYPRLRDSRFLGIPYLIARSDMFLSKFNLSRYLGLHLICKANK